MQNQQDAHIEARVQAELAKRLEQHAIKHVIKESPQPTPITPINTVATAPALEQIMQTGPTVLKAFTGEQIGKIVTDMINAKAQILSVSPNLIKVNISGSEVNITP